FQQYGLKTASQESFLQPFEFIAGIKYGDANSFKARQTRPKAAAHVSNSSTGLIEFRIGEDYVPLNFSSPGAASGELVLAGYGIAATGANSAINYDDYAKIDVKDK